MERSSGILLPIFSLPSKYGIGTFGQEAYKFVDYLKDMKVGYWQVLPMHPITYGNSPYQSTSTFAGNELFIDLEFLVEEGFLEKDDIESIYVDKDFHKVDYDAVVRYKLPLLKKAAKKFLSRYGNDIYKREEFDNIFKYDENVVNDELTYEKFRKNFSYFLDDFAVFSLIKDRYSGKSYSEWDRIHRLHYDDVIDGFLKQNADEVEIYKVVQYFFFKQWFKLKKYANDNGIKIIGDMPIYSSLDSVEVFCDYKNFLLNADRRPIKVAGCPPDAYAKDGQLWSNPLYDYNYMKKDGYSYFIKRLKHLNLLYDVVRIDHFRGFASYYAIDAKAKTAKNGEWLLGPGIELFDIIKKKLPKLVIIAEDLGLIDDTVINLLKATGFPGMKVVEFAFGGDVEKHQYLPKNFNENAVAYLGTHDNNTFMGWFDSENNVVKEQAIKYLHLQNNGYYNRDAIKELFKSKANLCIVLLQDLLGLGENTRINTPSTVGDFNWSYRFTVDYLNDDSKNFLRDLIIDTKR